MAKKSQAPTGSKKQPAAAVPQIRSRIVETVNVRAGDLEPHPLNWRKHSKLQQSVLRAMLEKVGYVSGLIARRLPAGNYQLIDGHLRSSIDADAVVPVQVVDLTDEEVEYVLARFDPIGALAQSDRAAHQELLKRTGADAATTAILSQIVAAEQKAVDAALASVTADDPHEADTQLPATPSIASAGGGEAADEAGPASEGEEVSEEELEEIQEQLEFQEQRGIYALREDVVFPSSNEWGIPDLLPDLLATEENIPTSTWATQPITDPHRTFFLYGTNAFPPEAKHGVLGFFVDDYRFETVWSDCVRIIEKFQNFGWSCVCTPDFSTWDSWPWAVKLFNVFRSRWCARYWQEAGIRVMPTLSWDTDDSHNAAYFGTLPQNCPVVAVQCRTMRRNKNFQRYVNDYLTRLAVCLEVLAPRNLVVYGGTEAGDWFDTRKLPGSVRYHMLEAWTAARARVRAEKKALASAAQAEQ